MIWLFCFSLFFIAHAEDHGGGEHAAAKAESHGGGAEVARPLDDYYKDIATLEQTEGQLIALEKSIRDKIEEKNKTKDKEQLKVILADIKEELKKRKELVAKYAKLYNHTRYNHPEKGQVFEARYKKIDSKYEKEFEDEVNGLLSNIMSGVRKQYPKTEE